MLCLLLGCSWAISRTRIQVFPKHMRLLVVIPGVCDHSLYPTFWHELIHSTYSQYLLYYNCEFKVRLLFFREWAFILFFQLINTVDWASQYYLWRPPSSVKIGQTFIFLGSKHKWTLRILEFCKFIHVKKHCSADSALCQAEWWWSQELGRTTKTNQNSKQMTQKHINIKI